MSPSSPPTATPSRRFGAGALLLASLFSALVAAGAVIVIGGRAGPASEGTVAAPAKQYQCPMHPSIVRDHPGNCPICGMALVEVETPRRHERVGDHLPVHAAEISAETRLPGFATIDIDPARQQLIGLATAEVVAGRVGGTWRTVLRLAADETRVRRTNVKVGGYVERVYADFVGKAVRRGDRLFSMYSPEILAAQQEYLFSLSASTDANEGAGTGAKEGAVRIAASRRRLDLWDVSPSQIEQLERTREPLKTIAFHSPVSGVVTRKDVVEGMRLEAGAMPYEIVDLSTVWALAEVYESELRHVRLGMTATVTLNAFPSRTFRGRVAFIDPSLDPQTRTARLRLVVPNPTGELRPEMYGEAVLHGSGWDGLEVPADAVIDSGTSSMVFVALGDGKFEPRQVQVGATDRASVEVRSGLEAGERVVVRANFLVDSESQLRASLAALSGTARAPERARALPSTSGQSDANTGGAADPDRPHGGTL